MPENECFLKSFYIYKIYANKTRIITEVFFLMHSTKTWITIQLNSFASNRKSKQLVDIFLNWNIMHSNNVDIVPVARCTHAPMSDAISRSSPSCDTPQTGEISIHDFSIQSSHNLAGMCGHYTKWTSPKKFQDYYDICTEKKSCFKHSLWFSVYPTVWSF